MSCTLSGSLNNPSFCWPNEGEVGADCSALSSACSCERGKKLSDPSEISHGYAVWIDARQKAQTHYITLRCVMS